MANTACINRILWGAHVVAMIDAQGKRRVIKVLGDRKPEVLDECEEAVHAVTAKQARFFGIPDRGVIAIGTVADLVVFDLAELDAGTEIRRADLPGGSWRYSRTPGGYRATVVAGVPTWLDGGPTGNRSGRMLPRKP